MRLQLTHEEIIRVRIWAADAKELHKVMKLTMYVSTDGYRAFLESLSVLLFVSQLVDDNAPRVVRLIPLVALLEPAQHVSMCAGKKNQHITDPVAEP